MKTCYKCKQTKILSEFHKDCVRVDGYSDKCKVCKLKYNKMYSQTETGKIAHRKSNARYQKSEKGKATDKRFNLRHTERRKAKSAVYTAIRDKRLSHPNTLKCRYCPEQAKHYHHPSYHIKQRLTIIPVCRKCHTNIHRKIA